MDGTAFAAIMGFLGVLVTVGSGVFLALRTNKSEKTDVAQVTLEKTRDDAYEQRLLLRDEQIADLKSDLMLEKLKVEELENENDKLRLRNVELRKNRGIDDDDL